MRTFSAMELERRATNRAAARIQEERAINSNISSYMRIRRIECALLQFFDLVPAVPCSVVQQTYRKLSA
jgi:hypothetical protein